MNHPLQVVQRGGDMLTETSRVSRRLICLSPGLVGWDALTVVEVLELCCRDVAEFAEHAAVVEPVDPFEDGEFEVVEAPAEALVADQFGLVEPEHRFGQGIVVGIAA